MLSPGGVVIGHDYLMIDDVTKALATLAARRAIGHVAGTTLALARNDHPSRTAA